VPGPWNCGPSAAPTAAMPRLMTNKICPDVSAHSSMIIRTPSVRCSPRLLARASRYPCVWSPGPRCAPRGVPCRRAYRDQSRLVTLGSVHRGSPTLLLVDRVDQACLIDTLAKK
jgi:hypothetical protein